MAKTSVTKTTAEDEAAAPVAKAKPAAKKTTAATKTVAQSKAPKAAAAVPPEQAAPAKTAAKKVEAGKAKPAVKVEAKPEAKPEAEPKPRKPKLVRDSFTMPEAEYAALGEIKKACLKAGVDVKKSELLRAGVALLKRLDTAGVRDVLASLPSLKAGRPKKSK